MRKISLALASGLLLACTAMSYYFKKKKKPATLIYESRITVTGSARNISGHAAVVAPSAAVYYVEGMDEWEPGWLNHSVRITGDLVSSTGHSPYRQERAIQLAPATQVIKAAVVLLLQTAGQELQ